MAGLTISARGRSVPASPIRKLVPLADAARARGLRVIGLNIGQPDIPTPEVMWEAIRKGLPRTLAYSPSGGIPELRKAFSDYYAGHEIRLDPSEIIVTAGGSEAILFAIAAVVMSLGICSAARSMTAFTMRARRWSAGRYPDLVFMRLHKVSE